jgi:GT2 family glycosyltransferase/glycosyltransferase involved in cell wall biosynthesis
MARGHAALEDGDLTDAARWLDRARRVAGGSDAVDLLLASVWLRLGDTGRAAATYAALASRHDLREAWLGLAAARMREGRLAESGEALVQALSGHDGALPKPLAGRELLTACDATHWCWLDNGAVTVVPHRTVRLSLGDTPLRRLPRDRTAGMVDLSAGQARLLPRRFDLQRLFRLDAFVDEDPSGDGLAGYAWYPNQPARPPRLTVVGAGGRRRSVTLGLPGSATMPTASPHDRPLAQPRAFRLARAALPGAGPYRIIGPDGRDITGSPIDPLLFRRARTAALDLIAGRRPDQADLRGVPVPVAAAPPASKGRAMQAEARAAIVIPVYGAREATLACLASIARATDARPIVVDDAGPDPVLARILRRFHDEGRIRLIRHQRGRGFPGAANSGIKAAGRADVVLLNSDTLVGPRFLDRLRDAAYAAPDIGTATPFSNDATLLSYPRQAGGNQVPDQARVRHLAAQAHRALGAAVTEIPTAVGFCMYIRRDCLDRTGLLREDVFAQGYGEENDFCLRARALGWRHVAAAGVYVGHVGGASFGAARTHLLRRNLGLLNRLHPGYDALVAAEAGGASLAACRRRFDLARLTQARHAWSGRRAVLIVTHDVGGGVETQARRGAAAIAARGGLPVLLRPVLRRPLLEGTGACRVDLALSVPDLDLPNLVFDLASERSALLRLLARFTPERLEYHHMLGHAPALLDVPRALGLPYDVHLHDYAWFCPRVTLVAGAGRYCGEPDLAGCADCIADHGALIDDPTPVGALVARSAAFLGGADTVIAPSVDTAQRYARHFPSLRPIVRPWDSVAPSPRARAGQTPRRVAVLGAIGIEKGYGILLACARDAARRALPLNFIVIGHTTDDARLLQTGAVFITGEYKPAELPSLIAAVGPDVAFIPSIWPETWCFTLSEAWAASLHAVVFDIGAPAERIRRAGGGTVLPLACPPERINAVLLGA